MMFLLSPAKSMKIPGPIQIKESFPRLMEQSLELIFVLKQKSTTELGSLMGISQNLSRLNHQRFSDFTFPYKTPAYPCALFFDGDVYKSMQAQNFQPAELEFLNSNCRILSGLYGLLRPADLILPYRLEMGISLTTSKGKNLYEFWGDQITDLLIRDLEGKPLINLASNEYFQSILTKKIKTPLIHIHFQEERENKLRAISLNSKRARGEMANFIVKNKIENPQNLKDFNCSNYRFHAKLSTGENWFFTR